MPTPAQQDRLLHMACGPAARSTGRTIFFWEEKAESAGPQRCLSNYYRPAPFKDPLVDEEQAFTSTEQYMHFFKGVQAGDRRVAKQIRGEHRPWKCKELGRQVEPGGACELKSDDVRSH